MLFVLAKGILLIFRRSFSLSVYFKDYQCSARLHRVARQRNKSSVHRKFTALFIVLSHTASAL